jgi:hypothetical protein
MYEALQPKTDYKIGDVININWSRIDYEGKSVRRGVMDTLIERCLGLPVKNLANYIVNMRYMLDSNSVNEYIDLVVSFVNGERKALPRRRISEAIDNFKEGVIVGMEVSPHHLSDICPAHISYIENRNSQLIRYTVMVVGIIDKGTDKEREVVFKVELLGCDFEKMVK